MFGQFRGSLWVQGGGVSVRIDQKMRFLSTETKLLIIICCSIVFYRGGRDK